MCKTDADLRIQNKDFMVIYYYFMVILWNILCHFELARSLQKRP